jgi:hypothetical protein
MVTGESKESARIWGYMQAFVEKGLRFLSSETPSSYVCPHRTGSEAFTGVL